MTHDPREALEAERAELIAKNEAATSWGAAVGARHERIKEIDRALALTASAPNGEPVPFAYAYEYPDCFRFETGGREINGNKPLRSVPLYTSPPPPPAAEWDEALEAARLAVTELDCMYVTQNDVTNRYEYAGIPADPESSIFREVVKKCEAAIEALRRGAPASSGVAGTYGKDIERKMMEVADLIAATLDQPSDQRAWDHLLIYAPRDALDRRLSTLNHGEHHDTVLAPLRTIDEVRQRYVDRGGLEPRSADQVANEPNGNAPVRMEVSGGGNQGVARPDAGGGVREHKWFDHECQEKGCQSLVWKDRYESAVKGRADFRNAYRAERDKTARLEHALSTPSDAGNAGAELSEFARDLTVKQEPLGPEFQLTGDEMAGLYQVTKRSGNASAEARLREALEAARDYIGHDNNPKSSRVMEKIMKALSAGGDEAKKSEDEYHHQYVLDDYIDLCRKGFPKGWHMVCHDFQNEVGITAIRYLTDGKIPSDPPADRREIVARKLMGFDGHAPWELTETGQQQYFAHADAILAALGGR